MSRVRRRLTLAVACLLTSHLAAAQSDPFVTATGGDLYQVHAGAQTTIFLVAGAEILLADPLDRDSALWLQGELARRFPGRSVRYGVHTGAQAERAAGAFVFKSAEWIAQRGFNAAVAAGRREAPERYARVQSVSREFSGRRSLTVGGRTIELIDLSGAYGPGSAAIYFPDERLVFAGDGPGMGPSSLSFGSVNPFDALAWTSAILERDAETVLTASGDEIRRMTIATSDAYLRDLVAGVIAGFETGQSVAQLEAAPFLDAHKGTPYYVQRGSHIAEVYRTLRLMRLAVYATAGVDVSRRTENFCAFFTTCTWPGTGRDRRNRSVLQAHRRRHRSVHLDTVTRRAEQSHPPHDLCPPPLASLGDGGLHATGRTRVLHGARRHDRRARRSARHRAHEGGPCALRRAPSVSAGPRTHWARRRR
jgi:glyoxylase-like metal-dependent hydrolase (beta-lactamase superfamily II)